jgi:hypothetical protein
MEYRVTCLDRKLELQLEILTLSNNIEKFSKFGWSTERLQNRLDFCFAQIQSHVLRKNIYDENSSNSNFVNV